MHSLYGNATCRPRSSLSCTRVLLEHFPVIWAFWYSPKVLIQLSSSSCESWVSLRLVLHRGLLHLLCFPAWRMHRRLCQRGTLSILPHLWGYQTLVYSLLEEFRRFHSLVRLYRRSVSLGEFPIEELLVGLSDLTLGKATPRLSTRVCGTRLSRLQHFAFFRLGWYLRLGGFPPSGARLRGLNG